MATADLGWCLARCKFELDGTAELVICDPASEDAPANSLTVAGPEAILMLHDLIEDALRERDARLALAKDVPASGVDATANA